MMKKIKASPMTMLLLIGGSAILLVLLFTIDNDLLRTSALPTSTQECEQPAQEITENINQLQTEMDSNNHSIENHTENITAILTEMRTLLSYTYFPDTDSQEVNSQLTALSQELQTELDEAQRLHETNRNLVNQLDELVNQLEQCATESSPTSTTGVYEATETEIPNDDDYIFKENDYSIFQTDTAAPTP